MDSAGVDLRFEIHPGEDLHDGVAFERFLEGVGGHVRANILYDPSHFVLQHLDYLAFVDTYHDRIKAFHAKDAEFRLDGRSGVYGGYIRTGPRDPVVFVLLEMDKLTSREFSASWPQYGYDGWAVLEWECCLKHPEDGAREDANFIASHIIRKPDRALDDFAATGANRGLNRKVLGLEDPQKP